jgi:hypothetical protein
VPADESDVSAAPDERIGGGVTAKVIPVQTCPVCHERFTPYVRRDKQLSETCRDAACVKRWATRLLVGVVPVAANAANQAKKAERIQAHCREHFGELTARDTKIFTYARQIGWREGYNAAYHKQFPRSKRA